MNAKLRLALTVVPLTIALAPAQSALAAAKLKIGAPVSGITVAGKQKIEARLTGVKNSSVTSARFYFNGQLISTDHSAPFTVARDSFIDTNTLPAGSNRLKFKVAFSVRRSGGRIVEKTRRLTVRVHVFRPPTAAQPLPAASWAQIFNDDFASPVASQATWKTQRDDWIKRGVPYSNLEGAGYLPSNVRVANGLMNISTSHRASPGFVQSTGSVNTNKNFSFKYGYIEARLLIPACSGCWPAFWMLPSADHWPPEIDIIEYFDTSKQVIPYSAVHWPVPGPKKEEYFSQRLRITDFDNYLGTWHTYGVLWTKRTVQFYIDGFPGPQFSKQSKIPHLAMYPIIQLAVGAGHRPPAGSTMQVDYVRAWSRKR
ncbi:MAG: family 16 glycosylhydrolase [Thermoleophilaceae bacterium]|nr:family 16 glycosylhydrolase [Thermoleophilaceae bacterium]